MNKMITDVYPTITLSDSAGRIIIGAWAPDGYSYTDLDDGKYSVLVTLEGYKNYDYSFSISGESYSVKGHGSTLAYQKQWLEFISLEREGQDVFSFTVKVIDEAGQPIRNTEFVVGAYHSTTQSKSNTTGVLQSRFKGAAGEYGITYYTDGIYDTPAVDIQYTKFIVDKDGEIVVTMPN
jgi:hypothetical protein